MSVRLHTGDAQAVLSSGAIPNRSVGSVVTSPPYYGLRQYGAAHEEIGASHKGVERYVSDLVAVFDSARPLMRPDGVVWVNMGDTYNAYNHNRGPGGGIANRRDDARQKQSRGLTDPTLRNKSLVAAPQRFAVAMLGAGWILRADITWRKSAIPERVKDRPRRVSERLMMFTLTDRYAASTPDNPDLAHDVWHLATASGSSDHSARFSLDLAAACLSWSPPGVTVLDPFSGSGTTGMAALSSGRPYIGIDLYEANTAAARELLLPYAEDAA